ncbi:hypothetical protein AMC82_CH00639 [Rhizobium phaseoli]|nr:hypothetical protein AMC82_CH00639 [Rhizobium phaseoli]
MPTAPAPPSIPLFEVPMFRFSIVLLVSLSAAGCHTTQFGQSLGCPNAAHRQCLLNPDTDIRTT